MTRLLCCSSICLFILTCGSAALGATFDERLWERYAEVGTYSLQDKGGMAGMYLEPGTLGDVLAGTPFADLRLMTDKKEEVPYQIVARRGERREEVVPAQLRNLSATGQGETWLELVPEQPNGHVTALEVTTPDVDFSRQVQVPGSSDGRSWNTLRKDGVIFDSNRGERLRRTRVEFPETSFRHLALKIADGGASPLTVSGVKVLQQAEMPGQNFQLNGTTEQSAVPTDRQESVVVVRMNFVFPLDRLLIGTTSRNFQRTVVVQVRRGNGEWERWAQGTIYNFDTAKIHETQLAVEMPEIAAREFRLVFRNLDSPPIAVTGVTGEGSRRLLVFKQQADRKLYLFWGNPLAKPPRYDLAELVAKQKPDELPIVTLGRVCLNTKFAGNGARLPFTERYKYPLYLVVSLVIAGLVFLQYRVFRRVGDNIP